MARRGNQQKNGVDKHASNHKKKLPDAGIAVPEAKGRGKQSSIKNQKGFSGEKLPYDNQPNYSLTENSDSAHHAGEENKCKISCEKSPSFQKDDIDAVEVLEQLISSEPDSGDCIEKEASLGKENRILSGRILFLKNARDVFFWMLNGLQIKHILENFKFSDNAITNSVRASAIAASRTVSGWLERQRPLYVSLKTNIINARDHIRGKMKQAYPIVLRWLMHFGNILLLLSMVWLDCTLRGIDSFLRMGTTSLFSVIWCSIFSVIAMVGMLKFMVVLVLAVLVAVFVGFSLALLVLGISGMVFLWLYGSFWTTLIVVVIAGLAFTMSHERIALLITTVYSLYSGWMYVGWLGLLLALNLSFISSDVLIYYLKNNIDQHRRPDGQPEDMNGMHGRPGFSTGDSVHASFSENGASADRGPGVPSTSGTDTETTPEDEVIRLLNCTDHYSALGLSRYADIDVTLLKREYRRKAMLVHPDKNMGNEKAAEAFKKLQNAYEILLDSLKRKAYDDELRREDLLNYIRRFQTASKKNGRQDFFTSGFAQSGMDGDSFADARRIACKNCNGFHIWIHTKKSKSRARWCQECKDFHQAKDGDGWVEQSSQPFLFGLLQKVDAPSAYVCADSKIYDATEWYICQGMRCPVNTHKPSFHVNTSVTSKHSTGKGSSSGQRGRMPTPNMEENMTEEEFFEWLQNAVQAGMFENFGGSTSAESPSSRAGSSSKGGGNNTGSTSGSKRRKKGKKQW